MGPPMVDRPARSFVPLRFAPQVTPRHARDGLPGMDSLRGRTCKIPFTPFVLLTCCLLPALAGAANDLRSAAGRASERSEPARPVGLQRGVRQRSGACRRVSVRALAIR